jgi:undecaprenyl-phosphate 4-deoxy-4-formamido-L-arabinose transferase
MSVSVVIPCYCSAGTLRLLVGRLERVLGDLGEPYEVVLVVDGSPDETWDIASALAGADQTVRAVRLSRNYGQHNALLAGIMMARHETIVTMDDDLQHRPDQIPLLLSCLTHEIDLVYGVPVEEEHNWLRSLASRTVKSTLSRGFQIEGAHRLSAFRAFRAELRDAFAQLTHPNVNIDVALSWSTTRAASVTVAMDQRTVGGSNYTTRMLLRHAFNMVVGYSTAPLRIVFYLGIAFAFLGGLLVVVLLWSYFSGQIQVAGFTSLLTAITVFSSAQLVALGVLGEYVGAIHRANAGSPSYIVREIVAREKNSQP